MFSSFPLVSAHHFVFISNKQQWNTVIQWYDHIVTFPDEVTGIWCRPKTLISYLYIANRYTASLGNIVFFILGFMTLEHEVSAVSHSSAHPLNRSTDLEVSNCRAPATP